MKALLQLGIPSEFEPENFQGDLGMRLKIKYIQKCAFSDLILMFYQVIKTAFTEDSGLWLSLELDISGDFPVKAL